MLVYRVDGGISGEYLPLADRHHQQVPSMQLTHWTGLSIALPSPGALVALLATLVILSRKSATVFVETESMD